MRITRRGVIEKWRRVATVALYEAAKAERRSDDSAYMENAVLVAEYATIAEALFDRTVPAGVLQKVQRQVVAAERLYDGRPQALEHWQCLAATIELLMDTQADEIDVEID